MSFTKAQLRTIRDTMQSALDELNIGVEFQVGNISYTAGQATIKVTALEVSKDGNTYDPAAEDFKRYAVMYGARPDDLGKKIVTYHGTYTLVGLKPNNTKYPVIGERDGKRYKFEADVLKYLK